MASFLGLIDFLRKFIQDYDTISEPLDRLHKRNISYEWSEEQGYAYGALKKILTLDAVVKPFDVTKESIDASEKSIVGVLTQMDM